MKTHTGMKRDSVGCETDWLNVPGNKMKRARMSAERRTKRTRSKMKIMVPIVVRLRKRWGVTASRRGIPPVLIVRVNHLGKESEGVSRELHGWEMGIPSNVRPGEMM